jgi:tetratricopeptide (TPR) repeat protein
VSWTEGAFARAIAQYEEAVELVRQLADPLLLSDTVYNLGMAAFQGGEAGRARTSFEEAEELARGLGDVPHLAAAQFMLASLDLASGDIATAAGRARESYSLYASLGDDRSCARSLVVLAGAAAADDGFEEAARLTGAAESLRGTEQLDEFERPVLEGYLARVESTLGAAQTSRLKTVGRGLRGDVILAEVVSLGIEE